MMYTHLQIKEAKRLSTLPLVQLVCLQSLFWEMTSCVLLGHMERLSLSLSCSSEGESCQSCYPGTLLDFKFHINTYPDYSRHTILQSGFFLPRYGELALV